jgi:hypothetical protein
LALTLAEREEISRSLVAGESVRAVAAKLNAGIGCPTVCPGGVDVGATIAAADAWMWLHPVGSGVSAGGPTSPWRQGEPLYILLDQYNNGLLCVPHRD